MFMLMLTCNLNAQEASPENTNESESVVADIVNDVEETLDSALDSEGSASQDDAAEDDAAEDEVGEDKVGEDEAELDELDEDEDYVGELDEDELDKDDLDEEEYDEPISVRVNEDGELVGQARASVSGNWLPVEANIALVSNGVLLSKTLAEPDGSFAFQDIAPGDYNIYGNASSFCGQRAVTVLQECGCPDNVDCRNNVDCFEGIDYCDSADPVSYTHLTLPTKA